jgi:hypothetical protein
LSRKADNGGRQVLDLTNKLSFNWAKGTSNTLFQHSDRGSFEVGLIVHPEDFAPFKFSLSTTLFSSRMPPYRPGSPFHIPAKAVLASGSVQGVMIDSVKSKRHLHGILMGVSWAILLPLGPIFARVMQLSPKNRRNFWFKLHVICQSLGVLLSTVGYAYALASFSGGLNSAPHGHAKLGTVVVAMSWVQVLAALYRPAPEPTMRRSLWAGLHWLVGRSAVLLGVVNVLIGIEVLGLYNDEDRAPWFIGFSVPFALFCVFFGDLIFRHLVQRHQYKNVGSTSPHKAPRAGEYPSDSAALHELASTEELGRHHGKENPYTISPVGAAMSELDSEPSTHTVTLNRRASRMGQSEL